MRLQKDGEDRALVDGGIFVNNPAMAAYAEVRNLYPDTTDFLIVAVGTGDRDDKITYQQAKGWGLLGWAKQVIPVMMDSVSEAVDYELRAVFGVATEDRNFRLQSKLTIAANEMDDTTPENLQNLKAEAQEVLTKESKKVDRICELLRDGRGSDMPGTGLPMMSKRGAKGAGEGN